MNSLQEMGNLVCIMLVFYLFIMKILAHKDFGHFYGSSYVAAPNGSRTPVSVVSVLYSVSAVGFE